MHELAEPNVSFVNFCTQIKDDVVLLLDLTPRVHGHLSLLQVERYDKDLTVVFLCLRNDKHLLNIALRNEVVLHSSPRSLFEYELLQVTAFIEMALLNIVVFGVFVVEVYDVCMLAQCDVCCILI